ncbi:flagellar hook-associated protein FlgL [Thauera sp.]|jgi:flagellar hook-associated protein 3 FlgL|uniref:flagellar hook-associated protein FlgL n=1 Tax=Thauera sp. TaxID=1905334 RepID=UPI002A366F27|nr:flagellar hook-associated protein FlgL [Thauera sp.]MDX9884903.1 flagellar hook-associated protein FlgL [Thauera sp.]
MRVSTNMIYDQGVRALQTQSAALLYTGQQIATGRKILTPADDPVASARALDVTQSRSVNKQFTTNQGYAEDALKLVEGQLDGAGEIIQYARERVLAAGNPALSDADRKSIATDLRAQFDAMLAIANTRDANGDYLFAGYKSDKPAFDGNSATLTAAYDGDQGIRTMQVSSSRFMPVSFGGERVFGAGDDSVFKVLGEFISALEGGGVVSDAVSTALGGLDTSLDNVLTTRAQIGSQLVEVEQLGFIGSDLDLQYATTLSNLQDLDYNEAISRLTQQQTYLQAAQQSFLKITGLSLFNYLN